MSSQKTPNIDAIDNIITMAQTMSTLGISADGLSTLEEMRTKVKSELRISQSKANWTAGKAFAVFSETRDEDARKRQELLEFYRSTYNCLTKMDNRLLDLLNTNFAVDVKEAMRNQEKCLDVKEYIILVAGETSAGKSSLINLILGEELLPSALLSTTSTICELRYGKEKKVRAHYKKGNSETNLEIQEIFLSEPREGASYIDQLSPYLHVKDGRERGSLFKKIELFWPHELLEKGIVIVDSPGIGESDIMDEIVTDYLPEAFCFMYVINSANAGGIQRDRIEKLLSDARNIAIEKEHCFLSECALFICNKWDTTPVSERTEIKEHIIKKLERCWPNINPSSQVVYLATTEAAEAQRLGAISGDFEILINAFKSMVLTSIEARIQTYWKWLDYLLSRMSYHTKAFIRNADRDDNVVYAKLVYVAERIKTLENDQVHIMKDLQKQLNDKIDEVARMLSKYLTSASVRRSLTSWTDDDAPKKQETWIATENDVMKVIKNRFRDEIVQWEADKHVFSDAKKSLVQSFSSQVNILHGEIQSIEDGVVSDQPANICQKTKFTTGEKVIIGVTSPVWLPIGVICVLISLPVLGVIAAKQAIAAKSNLWTYTKDRGGYLSCKANEYLADFSKEESLRPYVKDHLKEVQILLNKTKAKLPAIIAANHLLIIQLLCHADLKKEALKSYYPINSKVNAIRGNLSVFAIQEVMPADINFNDLVCQKCKSSLIGEGAFSNVYKASIKKSGKEVALKVFKDVVKNENAYQLLSEEKILRKLKHPYIVKFYGTSLMREDNDIRMVFVMELCVDNIKGFLDSHAEKAPGKSRGSYPAVVKNIVQWAIQISMALDFIHKQGIVHRDLKRENILISKDDSIRIADVGISKKINEITGTLAGTPIYIAPEMFTTSVYDSRADMYSFGLILWEMWHGVTAFLELGSISCGEFNKMVQNGYRPVPPQNNMPPPQLWEDVMTKCWATKPEERKTAHNCKEDLFELMKCFNT